MISKKESLCWLEVNTAIVKNIKYDFGTYRFDVTYQMQLLSFAHELMLSNHSFYGCVYEIGDSLI